MSQDWEALYKEEYEIVDRIWKMFGSPSYQQLNGRDIYALITKLQADRDALLKAAKEIFLELDGRYDGAEDSRTKWMGEHLTRLNLAIARAERDQ